MSPTFRAVCGGLVLLFASPGPANAVPGVLDSSFGAAGIVTTPIGAGDDRAHALVIQTDDRIVVAGSTHNGTDLDVFVARYGPTGALDPSFGSGGIVQTSLGAGDETAEAIALTPTGEIVVAGSARSGGDADVLLLRYLPGGTPDPSFGTAGVVRIPVAGGAAALAIVIEPNGRIAIAGSAAGGLLLGHFLSDGRPDSGYGPAGLVVTPVGGPAAANAIVRTGPDRFVVAGWVRVGADADLLLASYRSNGRLDTDFGSGGFVVTPLGAGDDVAEALVRTLGGFVVAGWSEGSSAREVVLARYTADGGLDPGFGTAGVVRTAPGTDAQANALVTDDDDRLLVAGAVGTGPGNAMALFRYQADGSVDTPYGTGGAVVTPIGADTTAEALAISSDGRSVVAGSATNGTDTDVALARHLGDPRCGNGLLEPENAEVCDGGNRAPGDCCGPTCQHDAAGSVCLDDGDPCTDDTCDGAGACAHLPSAAACDARLCYAARTTVPVVAPSLGLVNPYDAQAGTPRPPTALCAPGGIEGGTVDDAAVHEEAYRLKTEKRAHRQDVQVADRFGVQRLRVLRPDRLLVPTAVALDVPAGGAPPASAADAYECYRVHSAENAPSFPVGLQARVADAFGDRLYEVLRPRRLCLPTDVNGAGVANPRAHLLCYDVRPAAGEPPMVPLLGRIHTTNLLGAGRLDVRREDELCVPALREPCGVPVPCLDRPGQSADCRYDPGVTDPRHAFCRGPRVMVDAGHENFHTIEAGVSAGRWWGFARLLLNDGYDVQQSSEALTTMLRPSDIAVLVIANPTTEGGLVAEALPSGEVRAIVEWVAKGGSLLLVIDHTPYEQVGTLLRAIGLVRLPAGESPGLTFTRADGTLNGASAVATGPGPDTAIDEVTTFTGTAFAIAARPPSHALYEPVLVFPPDTLGSSGDTEVDLSGMLEAVAIEFGAGRIFVSGEAGGLTAQDSFGMQETPQNERYLRNVLWWLTQ
jgi:uncharacterized delta-60 repeat protein